MSKIILYLVLFSSMINDSYQQFGFFDSVSDLVGLYDGIDCSMKIVQIYFQQYRQPICCVYWQFRRYFEYKANDHCEQPENIRKLLSGEMLRDYADLSNFDCGDYSENSSDCSRFWSLILTIFVSQLICLILFFITTIILTWKLYRRHYYLKKLSPLMKTMKRNSSEATSLLTTTTIITDDSSNNSSNDDIGSSKNSSIISISNSDNDDDDFFSCHQHHHHHRSSMSSIMSSYSI